MGITIKDVRTARRIAHATKRVEAMGIEQNGRSPAVPPGSVEPGFWAQINGENTTTGLYSWDRLKSDGAGGLADAGVFHGTNNAKEINGPTGLSGGTRVWMTYNGIEGDDATKPRYVFVGPLGLFPVKVRKTGGSAGSKTTQCSFVYEVKDANGYVLGTNMTPLLQRPPTGKMKAPADNSVGAGYWDNTTFRLFNANEVIDTKTCSS